MCDDKKIQDSWKRHMALVAEFMAEMNFNRCRIRKSLSLLHPVGFARSFETDSFESGIASGKVIGHTGDGRVLIEVRQVGAEGQAEVFRVPYEAVHPF